MVRFGPNRISINSPEGLKAIYGSHTNTQKSRFYSVFNHFFDVPSTETTIDRDEHARKRRILSRALSDNALKGMENAVLDAFNQFCDQLSVPEQREISLDAWTSNQRWSPPQDMARLMSFMTFDIMGDICFGRNFETLVGEKNRDLIRIISDGAQALNAVSVGLAWLSRPFYETRFLADMLAR